MHQRPLRALSEVTLDIDQGECFGIVGTNGSGKSTFLQIISGTVVPTFGSLTLRGRVLPMLSIGAGFHPELTGRENVILQGAILGISRRTVLTRLPDIMDFAGLSEHADTPLKRYSSGMAARLSFAIGMRFPADIYIFDEVLAVLDGGFRARCIREIQQMTRSGPTVLFVSHDLEQISALCDRTAWLDKGVVRAVGGSEQILRMYRDYLRTARPTRPETIDADEEGTWS